MQENLIRENINKIINCNTQRIIISNKEPSSEYKKINIEKINNIYHISKYTEKQVFNENIYFDTLNDFILNQMKNFKQINSFDKEFEYTLKISKKNKVFISKVKNKNKLNIKTVQNNDKNYILKEYSFIPPLIDMGVFTTNGKIVSTMHGKFKQINKFLEIIDHSISKINKDTFNNVI
jgi:hypothetical protein